MRIRPTGTGRTVSGLTVAFLLAAALPLALSAQATQTAPKPAAGATQEAAKDLPPARQILDRHIEAIGGRKAVLARSSSHQRGTMSVPAQGMSAEIEGFSAKPNKTLVRFKIPGIGDVEEGFNGEIGWSISPMTGPMLTQGKQLEQRKFDADFYADLYDEARYTSMKTIEKTTFDLRECYKVSLVKKDGTEDFEFFDVKTGLRAGRMVTRESPMGSISATQTITDYKKFGDLLQATTMKQSLMGIEQIFTTTSVEYDKVDPAVFEPPAAIKALIK